MKLKLPFFLFVAVCLSLNTSYAQTPDNQYFIPISFPKSPNATAFAKYGDYPVNLYSGLPEISIPLYTVESGSLSIPITLSYHPSGMLVDEAPGWVGAGWSINTGGMISRRIMGTPDEGGYLAGWRDAATLQPGTYNADIDYLRGVVITYNASAFDTRPDIYSYDLPGHGGKFFYNSKNAYKIQMVPFSPLNIKGLPTTGFTVQDEHGNIYILGHTATETTATSDEHGNHNTAVTAWMLENMIAQNRRDSINFSYQSQFIQNPAQTGQTITVEDLEEQSLGSFPQSCMPTQYLNPSTQPVPNSTYAAVTEQDISQIKFKNGKVEFKLNSSPRLDIKTNSNTNVYRLDTIKISAYNFGTKMMEVQKRIVFYTSYFATVTGVQGRLKLDSLQILDKAGSIVQHYRFDYNTNPIAPFGSYSKDYWGYYNGKMDGVSSPTLIPKTQVPYQVNGFATPTPIYIGSNDPNSRNPDSVYMQAGILKTIHYPTGGYTTFAYQTNRYWDNSGVMQLTGGLRVANISSYDGINIAPKVKTYVYNIARPNFMVSGYTGAINYGFFMNQVTARWYCTPNLVPGISDQKRVRTYYSESANNLTPTGGNPVAYSLVTEYLGTPANNVGKSVYMFRDTADAWAGSATGTGVPVIYDYFYSRGQLYSKSDYVHNANGTYQVAKRQVNSYTAFPTKMYNGVGMVVGMRFADQGSVTVAYPNQTAPGAGDNNTYPFDDYSIVSDDNYQVGSNTYNYDMNDTTKYTVSSVRYHYDDTIHQQVVSVSHNDSRGNSRTSTSKYAYNFLPTGATSTGNPVLDTMINEHMYAEPIEKTETYTTSSGPETTASQLNVFQPGSIIGSILPYKISILNIPAPVTNFVPASVVSGSVTGDSRYTQMISFDLYDFKNNITQYTPRNSTPVSILWDYQNSLPVAQVKNAINASFLYTSFEADGKGGWSYTGSPITDVTAPTGAWVYPLSAGTITSSFFATTNAYVLSYWSNNGVATVMGGGSSISGTPLRSNNGWTYYEHQVPVGVAQVTISGSASIDELRLYPASSQMTTYTFDPGGIKAITDTKNQISYFEYDPFQRLKNIKDWNGNIVKNYGYHTYDQTVSNDAIAATTFTRNNCPGGTAPQSTTYAVPAGRYLSSTKASANAQAVYDLNTNGQLLANNPTVCGCPIANINVTFTNSTGLNCQATFSGITNPYYFPTSGSQLIGVPAGTYATVTINITGSSPATITMGTRSPVTGHSATFNNVVIANGSSDLSISIH